MTSPMPRPTTKEAYSLIHQGILALADVEANGIAIDVNYCNRKVKQLDAKIAYLQKRTEKSDIIKAWKRHYRQDFNLDSNHQLSNILFNVFDYKPTKTTAKGNPSVDQEALEALDIPVVQDLLTIRKLQKANNTYLKNFLAGQVKGILHPFFHLHTVKTYRSCVAKGTLIEVVRDLSKNPTGTPIEKVKAGNYVYCYDDQLQLTIKKVIWAGKTGKRKVVRLHWSARGKHGYLDVTPEHRIRLVSGEYVEAQKLHGGDFRTGKQSKHAPKIQTLAMGRYKNNASLIGQTGNAKAIHDHRLVYASLIGPLTEDELVHHKDENHFNNTPLNLEKMSSSAHAILHVQKTLLSEKARQNNIAVVKEGWRTGKYNNAVKQGEDHACWIHISKFALLKMIAQNGGKIKGLPFDFEMIKKRAALFNIDLKNIKSRYDGDGRYISKGRLVRLSQDGRANVTKKLKINFYKTKQLYDFYGIDSTRRWGNQCGRFYPHNHKITRLEYLDAPVDVYDIEVEGEHNFIANEICVHNSSSEPNFQNIPKRDKLIQKLVRRAIKARPGRVLVEVDYSGVEVRAAAWYHKDPTMLKYINDPTTDMHRDMAIEIYLLDAFIKESTDAILRQGAKNGFVFPEFYGDYWRQCAKGLWTWAGMIGTKVDPKQGIKLSTGTTFGQHLINKGVRTYKQWESHIEKVENNFWNSRFPVYNKWKEQHLKRYYKKGYFDTLTGFRCTGLMAKNDAINYPVQGVAFHCLLRSLIRINQVLKDRGFKSLIVGQIHDSIIFDAVPSELNELFTLVRYLMCEEIRKVWTWIITPLDVEFSMTPIDGSWYDIREVQPMPSTCKCRVNWMAKNKDGSVECLLCGSTDLAI